MIIATAGHVDHGKTLLVKALTGVDTDRLPEEKERGLTIDLGFAFRDLGDGDITGFIDVPGHERFVRTMVAGVAGTDLVLFVIAADDGPMPQTEEHLAILDLLGVTRGVIALSKIDRVSDERSAEVSAQIRALLTPTGLANSPIVPVSAVNGSGVDALRAALVALKRTVPARSTAGNFRLAIDRSFVLKGAGRVVTGTVFSGEIGVGDTVYHAPAGGELRIRAIHAQNRETERAMVGQRCALNIAGAGLREAELRRGDWIVAADANFGTTRFDAHIRVLASEARALSSRTPVHVHVGAAETTARISVLDSNKLEPGSGGLVHLTLDHTLHLVRGDRIVVRDQSARRTIAGGAIQDPLPDLRGRKRVERMAYLAGMGINTSDAALTAVLGSNSAGIELKRFTQAWNLRADESAALLGRVAPAIYGPPTAPLGILKERWDELSRRVVASLSELHAAAPERLGASIAELRRALPTPVAARLLDALLDALITAGTVLRADGVLRLPEHVPVRDPADEAMWRRVRPLLDVRDFKVPVVHDLLAPLGLSLDRLETFMVRAAKQGYLVRVSSKRYFLPSRMDQFAGVVHELAATQAGGEFSAADFRDRAGIGRNAVIEILEYFDRTGLTRRQGEVRIALKRPQ